MRPTGSTLCSEQTSTYALAVAGVAQQHYPQSIGRSQKDIKPISRAVKTLHLNIYTLWLPSDGLVNLSEAYLFHKVGPPGFRSSDIGIVDANYK
jgi:hypothetical protein